MSYTWESTNYKTHEKRTGEAASLMWAKEGAEEAHTALGFRDSVTRITGPRGAIWTFRPMVGRSGMVWEKQ